MPEVIDNESIKYVEKDHTWIVFASDFSKTIKAYSVKVALEKWNIATQYKPVLAIIRVDFTKPPLVHSNGL